MTTVRTYRSTDASAPVLTGQAGSLVALLDAVLVNGYGSSSAAGWTIAYTTTSKRAYRNSSTDGTGFYLNIDDTGGGAGSTREAFCTGFGTMSALATGTGQFPTSAQLNLGTAPAGAVVARKSNTADATARAWTCVADDTVFYLFMENGDQVNPTACSSLFFGDFFSYNGTSDTMRCMIVGRNNVNVSGGGQEWQACLNGHQATTGATAIMSFNLPGHFLAGSFTGIGGSLTFGKHTDTVKCGLCGFGNNVGTASQGNPPGASYVGGYSQGGLSQMPYPNPVDGGIYLAPLWIHHNNVLRGYFKGLWAPLPTAPLNHNDTFSGTGGLSGKTFLIQTNIGTGGASIHGQFCIETSSTWS